MKYDQMLQNVKNERIHIAIATAAELYLDVGIAETKMTDIAEECQLGVASLYRYFGTKQLFTVKAASHIWEMKIAELKYICSSPEYEAKTGIDQQLFYMTVVHCLMSICQKFARKQILRPEDLQMSKKELSLAIDMFLAYIRA